MKPVGYLINYAKGLEGECGVYYNYILSANGLFIEAENKLLAARVPVEECEVRGLAPLDTKIRLTYGSIPQHFFDLALNTFLSDRTREQYIAVIGDAGYHFYVPVQDGEGASVTYEMGENVVLDIHSHGDKGSWFSTRDNEDEKGLRLYGVIGNLDRTPIVKLRIGVYGYFYSLAWSDVFDGSLNGAVEKEREEVMRDELHGIPEGHVPQFEHHSSWLRWDWWFRR